jgi:hypothetical protein
MTNTVEQEIIDANLPTWTPVQSYAARFRDLIMRASIADAMAAATWYDEASLVANDIANIMGLDLERGASVLSAFSPRERWASNVRKAYAFANGLPVSGLTNNLRMAERAVSDGFEALKGLKTNAFARAIAGDSDAIVIDVWMMRAAGMPTDSPNKGQYRELSQAVSLVAQEFSIAPRVAQALIWIVERGSAA